VPIDTLVQPEIQLNFARGIETLTLELRHDIATAEFLVITHRADGGPATDNIDRFGDVDQAMAYLRFVEGRLVDDDWVRTEPEATDVAVETRDAVVAGEFPPSPSTRPAAQLFRINLPPPTAGNGPLAEFPRSEIDATFAEESPFAPESRFESKPLSPVPALAAVVPAPLPPEVSGPGEGELGGASYALERPLYCPHCREWIRTILVVRLSRMQVRFTSTLPRSGRALACSACQGVLSLELSGFV
jgi:hypothetical protein